MKHKIKNVKKGSIAEEVGIKAGDFLIKVNDKVINDVLEYLYEITSEYVEITVEEKDGSLIIYEIEKDFDEKLGLDFTNPILDKPNSCKNKCVFCFVDQLPKGLRKSLYFKDDDSRLSFLHGNYITLTNLSEEDLNRIIDLHISPINVSVHATDPEVRLEMIKNPLAVNLMSNLKRLTDSGIILNGQIVLCPGFNDGEVLDRTIKDLYSLGENFSNLAIVPVGLSKHRKGLEELNEVTFEIANRVIDKVEKYQSRFLKERNNRFVYLSDEFYIKAKREFPNYDDYNGFPQIENGVGLTVKLNHEVNEFLKEERKATFSGEITIITGFSAYENMCEIKNKVEKKYNKIKINIKKIKNNFFGNKITVAGLTTGGDIMKQLSKEELGDKIIIPNVMLKDDEDIFLDDVLLEEVEKFFDKKIIVVDNNGYDLVSKIIE